MSAIEVVNWLSPDAGQYLSRIEVVNWLSPDAGQYLSAIEVMLLANWYWYTIGCSRGGLSCWSV